MSCNVFVETLDQNKTEQKIQSLLPMVNGSISIYLNFVLSWLHFFDIEPTDLTPAGERYQPGARL